MKIISIFKSPKKKNQILVSIKNSKTVAFYTLGCKLNFSETSTIARKFQQKGYLKVDFREKADVYVINTCSVTELADKKCRNIIRKAIKNSPDAKIIAVGCYAQINPEEIAKIDGVDLILGSNEKFNIFNFLEKENVIDEPIISMCSIDEDLDYNSSYSINERTRAFLKVQDGCDYTCSYCTIPLARGNSRNAFVSEIVKQANEIAKNGVKEVVLTGVNIGDFGKSTNESLYELIQQLDKITGIVRFRISSIEPNLISNEIVEFVNNSEKFVPHFHIPLQSGSDKILGLMKRRYKREVFKNRVTRIKEINGNTCIGVDVIVGFPGETDADFDDTYQFLENLDITYLHVFAFSERKNTNAVFLDNKVSKIIKEDRSKKLQELSEIKRKKFYQNNVGKISRVIFEPKKINEKIFGFTDNYVKVETEYNSELINELKSCMLMGVNKNSNMNIEIIE